MISEYIEKFKLDSKTKKSISTFLLKIYIVLSLFFPAYESKVGNSYYVERYYAHIALAVYLIYTFVIRHEWKPKKTGLCTALLVLIGIYNILSLYYNVRYLHWYGEQINNTISFLFFTLLVSTDCLEEHKRSDIIVFLIKCIILSSICAVVFYWMGYSRIEILNRRFLLTTAEESLSTYGEKRFSWIYIHKSQCALMYVAFMLLFVKYRHKFKHRITYMMSMGLLLLVEYLTHSWTGLMAVGCLVVGMAGEWIRENYKKLNVKSFLWIVPAFAAVVVVFNRQLRRFLAERNLATLGSRLPIWKTFVSVIAQNPKGIGLNFNNVSYFTGYFDTNNAHNIFLNAMLRFSIPVGICFTTILGIIVMQCIRYNKNIMTLLTMIGLLFLLNIDYALLNYEVSMFLFMLYLCFMHKERRHRHISECNIN